MEQNTAVYKCDCCGKVVLIATSSEERAKNICSISNGEMVHGEINTFQIPEIIVIQRLPERVVTADMTEVHLCKDCAEKFHDSYFNIFNQMQREYCECFDK